MVDRIFCRSFRCIGSLLRGKASISLADDFHGHLQPNLSIETRCPTPVLFVIVLKTQFHSLRSSLLPFALGMSVFGFGKGEFERLCTNFLSVADFSASLCPLTPRANHLHTGGSADACSLGRLDQRGELLHLSTQGWTSSQCPNFSQT